MVQPEKMNVVQLRAKLRAMKIDATGRKSVLLERLQQAIQSKHTASSISTNSEPISEMVVDFDSDIGEIEPSLSSLHKAPDSLLAVATPKVDKQLKLRSGVLTTATSDQQMEIEQIPSLAQITFENTNNVRHSVSNNQAPDHMTVVQLRNELRAKKINSDGRKSVLVERLKQAIQSKHAVSLISTNSEPVSEMVVDFESDIGQMEPSPSNRRKAPDSLVAVATPTVNKQLKPSSGDLTSGVVTATSDQKIEIAQITQTNKHTNNVRHNVSSAQAPDNMTVVQLRTELRAMKIDSVGRKSVLVERLKEAIQSKHAASPIPTISEPASKMVVDSESDIGQTEPSPGSRRKTRNNLSTITTPTVNKQLKPNPEVLTSKVTTATSDQLLEVEKLSSQMEVEQLPTPARISITNTNEVRRSVSTAQTDESGVRCVAVGTYHQGMMPSGNNTQCVVMSACAASYSIITDRQLFTQSVIDMILHAGDKNYQNIINSKYDGEPVFLEPEEASGNLKINKLPISIFIDWATSGPFPTIQSHIDVQVYNELYQLFDNFDENVGFLLTTKHTTVSFWKHNSKFYLFNSHAVDATNKRNNNSALNRARLFEADNLKEFTALLFNYYGELTSMVDQYAIHSLRVLNMTNVPPVQIQNDIPTVTTENNFLLSESVANATSNSIDKQINWQPVVVIERLSKGKAMENQKVSQTKQMGRPLKKKRGQKKQVENAHLVAVKKYNEKNPDVHRAAVRHYDEKNRNVHAAASQRYSQNHPEVHAAASQRYSQNHPEVHAAASQRYSQNHPEVHAAASQRYSQNHPEVHAAASQRYSQNHPEVHAAASQRYSQNHPEVHAAASQRYSQNHPEVNAAAVQRYSQNNPDVHLAAVNRYNEIHPEVHSQAAERYRENHRDQVRESNRTYNQTSRGIEPALRRVGLIGEMSGEALNLVKLYTLKKMSLQAADTYTCPKCNAKLFDEEKGREQWCCGKGRYNVMKFGDISNVAFYSNPDFIKFIRGYNNLFAFSSLGVEKGFQHPQSGFTFLKIQGRVYHTIQDLGSTRYINQIGLYINDGEERQRLADERRLDRSILAEIRNFLETVNPFIRCFRRLSMETSNEAFLMFEKTSRNTHGNILGDMPDGREVAAIISTNPEDLPPKCIAVWKIGSNQPHTVDLFHPLYEALQYPILYPYGEEGFFIDRLCNELRKLSQTKYYRCLLLSEPRFSNLGRINDEWVVDMYSRVEEERLRFLAGMQDKNALRTATREEIAHQIEADETVFGEGHVAGRIYLPNTFTGSPRYMKVKYMDAMAVVSRIGKPSYFLTMTCNIRWPEIQMNTPANATRVSALTCARVFKEKLAQLLRDIRSGSFFGPCVYILHVIEFQKRGLPHAHIVFRVENGGPVQNTEIDKVIRADIPSENEAGGRLRKAVLSHMIHGPCGNDHRTDLPCWDAEKQKCSKFFPKRITNTTYTDDRGFVHLKRNADNKGTIKYRNQNVEVSDLWVVPYNAALLLKYDCHLNIEAANNHKTVKYLFKYLTKGSDQAKVAVVPEEHKNNEIEQYIALRYIGACEACWRMLEYDLTGREPNIKQLAVHLNNQECILFRAGNENAAVQKYNSDLIKYFNRPQGAEFDTLTYQEFYEQYFVYSSRPNTKNTTIHPIMEDKYFVVKRQRGKCMARLFWVSPNRGEQFYLRILLANFPCRSYNDLISLGGDGCETFQESARSLGLADDELEYEKVLEEAATFYTGPKLRHFFVLLITNGAPAAVLWDKFKDLISEDHIERNPQNVDYAYELALLDIDRLLRKHGTRLEDHGLPTVRDDTTELDREMEQHADGPQRDLLLEWLPLLSQEQQVLLDHVDVLLNNFNNYYYDQSTTNATDDGIQSQRAIFLDGPAGTGKTLLLNVIAAYVRTNLRGVVLCTASSGIAALNYEGGSTAHSMFRLPLDIVDDTGTWGITNGSQRAQLIREASLIIYDEAPMAHKYLIHLLDRSLRDLMQNDLIFGGKVIIFAGDFRQIPPVVPTARSHADIVHASLKTSPLWSRLRKFSLQTAQRTRNDTNYSDFLLKVGSGTCDSIEVGTGTNKQTLVSLANLNVVRELSSLIEFVFPDDVLSDGDVCAKRAILSTHCANVSEINDNIINKLPGQLEHCYSVDKVDPEMAEDFQLGVDILNKVTAKGVPDHDLQIKIGAVAMIIRNLSIVDRLVNGTKVIIVEKSPRIIKVRKPGEQEIHLIPRITFKTPIEPRSPIQMYRHQFPLQVCYAMTVHKSQGQTIEKVGVDLRSDIFSHGMLYVALGRVRDQENVMVLSNNLKDNVPHANNVVIRDLIDN